MNQESSLSVPQTQNTAPVLEFRCLYTPDIRRKQKRWQDGKVRFHTFNKRVMVYDERANFVGDTHWREDSEFGEGTELELERGGIMVDVQDCIGKRDQDLTELVDKRIKDREERAAAKIIQASPSRPQTSSNLKSQIATPADTPYLRQKPLNAVIGTPTGHYGRAAISNLSPFEERQQNNRNEIAERPAKRLRQDDKTSSKNGYAQNLMGATLTLSSARPPSTATMRYEPFRPSIQSKQANTIDLTKDDEEDPVTIQSKASEDRTSRTSPDGVQKRKPKRSPPSRSGYASSLTGAALTLTSSNSFSSKHLGVVTYTKAQDHRWEDSSSAAEESFVEIDSDKTAAKPKEAPRKKEKSQDAPTCPSPPLTLEKDEAKPTSDIHKKITRDPSASRALANQPFSTLRIKSRAPRQMMMLMAVPSSRPPAPSKSSERSQGSSRTLQQRSPISQDAILPEIAKKLTASRERQDQSLQNPLISERPSINLEDLSSSPIDSGIDHQTIDNLLTRKKASKRHIEHGDDPSSELTLNETVKFQAVVEGKNANGSQISTRETDLPLGQHANHGLSHVKASKKMRKADSSIERERRSKEGEASPVNESTLVGDRRETQLPVLPQDAAILPNKIAADIPQSPPDSTRTVANTRMVIPEVTADQGVELHPASIPLSATVPKHVSSAISSATDHFRAILKSSVSPSDTNKTEEPSLPLPVVQRRGSEPPPGLPVVEKFEPVSSVIAIKASPQPSPIIGLGTEKEQLLTTRVGPTRLANPATRGPSVQVTARRTVDTIAMAPEVSSMLPPPRNIGWPGVNLTNAVAEPRREPVDEASCGPWSRESFDLFGSWRPPGRDSGANTVNG